MKQVFLGFMFFIVLVNCAAEKKSTKIPPTAITIMAYNVENLFDTKNDPQKNDEAFLPLSQKQTPAHRALCQRIANQGYRKSCLENDWNEQQLEQKMQRIAQVILSVKDGRGPDVVILEEVENLAVLEELRTKYLMAAGYHKGILIEGPDERGIDVGMLSRLPQAAPAELHLVALKPMGQLTQDRLRPTRGVLHGKFRLSDGTPLNVLGVHFPSQSNPTESRLQAIELVNNLGRKIPQQELVVVGGDFNISSKEEKRAQLYQEKLGKSWYVSHIVGCENCRGTHNYRGEWSFLDALLFSKNLLEKSPNNRWTLVPGSIRVSTLSPIQTDPGNQLPARFAGGLGGHGVSDHLPIVAEIVPNQQSE